MKIIIPCAGKSSRFQNMRPKWMLTHPDGNLMVKKVVDSLGVAPKDVIIAILAEHEEKYDIVKGLKENIGEGVTVVVLDHATGSQPETVAATIRKTGLNEPFLIKDSDNIFSVPKMDEGFNYVCYSDLQDYDDINPGNKSYIKMNDQNIITDIVEKSVASRFFNVGGYYFTDPAKFLETYSRLEKSNGGELYTSHVIADMILHGNEIFMGKYVKNYVDWGTWEQWSRYVQKFRAYFIDLDGVVFKSGAQYFTPRWDETSPLMENVEVIKKLCGEGNSQIFFVTARPEKCRKLTEQKLSALGLKWHALLMGCFHAKRVIINDFSMTSTYPSCEAINVLRDSEDLKRYLHR